MPPQTTTANNLDELWAIVPAAGHGVRMHADVPKQYLSIDGVAMLQRSIDALMAAVPDLKCVVALSQDDASWQSIPASTHSAVKTVIGGETRAESVAAGLKYIVERDSNNPWVLVHDAARPLVSVSDIERLLEAVIPANKVGGILGVPVQDTLKRSNGAQIASIEHTVERANMWQAQTPQLFRAASLLNAIQLADKHNISITDEASAMEYVDEQPVLVEALSPNFKITRETDRLLANALAEASHSEPASEEPLE